MPQSHESSKKIFIKLSNKEELLANEIVDSAFKVHSKIGPGLLEKIYETCFCHEFNKRGIRFERQVDIPIVYDGIRFEEGFRLDVLVEDLIICELKAVEQFNPIWEAQILSHLKLHRPTK